MATLEQALFQELSKSGTDYYDEVSGRVYPLVLPQSATLPASVYQRISTLRHHAFEEDTDLSRPRIQIDHYSTSYGRVKDVAEECRDLLQNKSGEIGDSDTVENVAVLLTDESEYYEEDTQYYRIRQDYFIYFDEDGDDE